MSQAKFDALIIENGFMSSELSSKSRATAFKKILDFGIRS